MNNPLLGAAWIGTGNPQIDKTIDVIKDSNLHKLSVVFGEDDSYIMNPDIYFNNIYEKSWFDNSSVKTIISIVDNSTIQGLNVLNDTMGSLPVESLSGGCKACILMLMTDKIINASACGDNCVPAIAEVLKYKDVTIRLGHLLKLNSLLFPISLPQKNKVAYDWNEFVENAEVV